MLTRRDSCYWKCRSYFLGLFVVSWRKVDFGVLKCLFQRRYPHGFSMRSIILNVLSFTRAKRITLSVIKPRLTCVFLKELCKTANSAVNRIREVERW